MTMGWVKRTDGACVTSTYILDQLVIYQIESRGIVYEVARKVVAAAVPKFVLIGVELDMDKAKALAEKDWEEGIL